MVGCSIGIAISGPLDMEVDPIIHRADMALYRAKMNGRGQAVSYGAELDEHRKFSATIPSSLPKSRRSQSKGARPRQPSVKLGGARAMSWALGANVCDSSLVAAN